jgi:hypothetical protein
MEKTKDKVGRVIPEHLLGLWSFGQEVQSTIKKLLAFQKENVDTLVPDKSNDFANQIIAASSEILCQAEKELLGIVYYAVCPYCQGMISSHCRMCRGVGLLNRLHYKVCVSKLLQNKETEESNGT